MYVLRTLTTLLTALLLALALGVPALAQENDQADRAAQAAEDGGEASVLQEGDEDVSTSQEDGAASAQQEDEGSDGASAEYSGPDQSRANNGRDDVNCEAFDFQEDAQEFFEAGGGEDEDGLDEDPGEDDGIACESLPSREEADDEGAPSGGVDSGAGGTAPQASSPGFSLGIPVVIAGGLVVFGLGMAARRRA